MVLILEHQDIVVTADFLGTRDFVDYRVIQDSVLFLDTLDTAVSAAIRDTVVFQAILDSADSQGIAVIRVVEFQVTVGFLELELQVILGFVV